MNRTIICILPLLFAGCAETNQNVRITSIAKPPTEMQARARSEPVFYNGKIYNLDFRPSEEGAFAMSVSGMSAKQEKDAVAIATSSLRYFACPDRQTGHVTNKPAYAAGRWKINVECI